METFKIKQLSANAKASISGEVTAVEPEREVVTKIGKKMKVCNVIVKDDTGEVSVSLWNEDIVPIELGQTLTLTDGWCTEYKGTLKVSRGKFGKIEVQ